MTRQYTWGDVLREIVLAVLGIILSMSIPAIWVAWTGPMLIGVVATGALAAVLYCLLYACHQIIRGDQPPPSFGRKRVLSDRFIAEVHRLFPLIYHHRSFDDPGFRRKMGRLKGLLEDRENGR